MKISKITNISIQILLATLILLSTCSNQEAKSPVIENVPLSHYQRLAISPKIYTEHVYRDVFENAIQFNLKKYRIPFIKEGTIKIEETSSTNHILAKTLHFKDSLLIKIINPKMLIMPIPKK